MSPARCRRTLGRSSLWPTCSSNEKFWTKSENCLCSKIQFYFPLHIYLANNWLWLPLRVQFWCSLESNLSDQMIFHPLVKRTHDMSLALQIVRTLQYVLSRSIVRLQLFSGILHQYKLLSIDLVVEAFPLVPCSSAINFLCGNRNRKSRCHQQ